MDTHGPNHKPVPDPGPDPSSNPLSPRLRSPPTHHGVSNSIKKQRSSATGSRAVVNLTPDQLAKKRANDREAQRAIRERTKAQIESLERQVRELTSRQPYQDLQCAIRQKERLEAENGEIKKRLKSMVNIIQPILNGQRIPDYVQPLDRDAPGTQYSLSSRQDGLSPSSSVTGGRSPHYHDTNSLRSGTSSSSTFPASPQAPGLTPPHQPSVTYPSLAHPLPPMVTYTGAKPDLGRGLDLPPSGERLSLGFLLDDRHPLAGGRSKFEGAQGPPVATYPPISAAPVASHATRAETTSDRFETPLAFHTAPVRNVGPTCALDGLLLDFLAGRRQRAAEGVPPQKLVGPAYPCVSTLLHPERSIYSHPLSKFLTDILGTFPDISALPEQVAVLYIMFLIMRWQIYPTQEAYERLPDWVTPRPSQLFTPHPAWVDHLPWPRMRDKMVHLYPGIPLENFFIPYTTTLSLNWPHNPSDTLIPLPRSDEWSINPVFENHLRDLNNWTLGPAFATAFPMLADTTKIKP